MSISLSDTALDLAKKGGLNFLSSLKKFFKDSKIINEINDRADKELFFPLSSDTQNYQYLASIREDDYFDDFIALCMNSHTLKNKSFLRKKTKGESWKARKAIKCFLIL